MGLNLKTEYVIPNFQNVDPDLGMQSYTESRSNVNFGVFQSYKMDIWTDFMLNVMIFLIPLSWCIQHGFKVDVETCSPQNKTISSLKNK